MKRDLKEVIENIYNRFSEQFYLAENNAKYWKDDLFSLNNLLNEQNHIELAYSIEKLSELNIHRDYNLLLKLKVMSKIKQLVLALDNSDFNDYELIAEISDLVFSFNEKIDYSMLKNEAKAGVDRAMIDVFVEESQNLLDGLNNNLLDFENDPENKTLINSLFRALHTIKGNSATLGFEKIKEVSHRVENVFDKFRKGTLSPDALTIDVLRVAIEAINDMVNCVADEKEYSGNLAEIIDSLLNLKKIAKKYSDDSPDLNLKKDVPQTLESKSIKDSVVNQNKSLRVSIDKLNKIVSGIGEVNIISHTIMDNIRSTYELIHKRKLISDQDVENVFNSIDSYSTQLSDLYNSIINTRMIPLSGIFKKYPVVIRDLARKINKKVKFSYSGENIEVDKQIFEEIADPIMHLIRNCVDHGIEHSDIRLKNGKPEYGLVRLEAYIEGGMVYILVSDDGAGLNRDKILSKALEKGILSEAQLDDLSENDIYNMIFEPGFSTKDNATDLSGRGVGMDVVRNNILKLRGFIKVDSNPGKGVLFTLSMPASLANQEILVVSEDIHITGIPVEFVVEVIAVSAAKIQLLDNKEVLEYRGHLIPFIYMRNIFGVKSIGHSKVFKTVILKVYNNFFAISVDDIERRQKVVIKPLSRLIKNKRYINSGSIMGDGHILLILDIYSVFDDLNRISLPVFKKKEVVHSKYDNIDVLSIDTAENIYIADDNRSEYIMFSVTDKLFAMNIKGIHQVMDLPELSHFPDLPEGIIGVYEYLNKIIPVYDMPGKMINDLDASKKYDKKVIVYENNGIMVGILCHKINKIIRLEDSEISSLLGVSDVFSLPIVKGLCKWGDSEVLIIDEDNLFMKFRSFNAPKTLDV